MQAIDRRVDEFAPALTVHQERALRAALKEQRAFRLDQLGELSRTDATVDEALAEVSATLRHGAQFALAEIDAALDRVRTGRYGACIACGERIAFERLEILPMAALCIECQRGRDSRGR